MVKSSHYEDHSILATGGPQPHQDGMNRFTPFARFPNERLTFTRHMPDEWSTELTLQEAEDDAICELYTQLCGEALSPSEVAMLLVCAKAEREKGDFATLTERVQECELLVYDTASAYRTVYQPERPGSGMLLLSCILGLDMSHASLIKPAEMPEPFKAEQSDLMMQNPWELNHQGFREEAVTALRLRLQWPPEAQAQAATILDEWA